MSFTIEEKDRFDEILLFYFFNDKNEKILSKATFWNVINNLCQANDIEGVMISRAIRILLCDENIPTEVETFYLFNKAGFTVRPINQITGIYYQKQTKHLEDFNAGKLPKITRRITDIVMKKSIRDFIYVLYEFLGIFTYVDKKIIENIF